MKALLIEFDLNTGLRAGGINPRDPKLPCRGWQDIESTPAKEIRLVEDERDLSIYDSVEGVTILNNKAAINKSITDNIPSKYKIQDMNLLIEAMKEKGIPLESIAGKEVKDFAKTLHEQSVAGIMKRNPKKAE